MKKGTQLVPGDKLILQEQGWYDTDYSYREVTVTKVTSSRIYAKIDDETAKYAYAKRATWPLLAVSKSVLNVVQQVAPKEYWDNIRETRAKRDSLVKEYVKIIDSLNNDKLEKGLTALKSSIK